MSADRNSKTLSPFFILMRDKLVHGHGRTALVNRPEAKDRQVLKGTLLEQVRGEGSRPHTSIITGPGGEKLKFRSLDHDNVNVECSHDEVARMSRVEKDLLLALVRLRERYDLYTEGKKLENGRQISIESMVYVTLPTLVHEALGKVRYKGPLPGQPGTHFGVELMQDRGQGTTDGTFRKHRLFHCDQDCGVFVTLQKIRLIKSEASNVLTKSKDKDHKNSKTHDGDEIQIGMRVVIFCADDNGKERAEYGCVRYIGVPKKLKGDTYIGIELDNPAGQGTGKFEGERLFTTKRDHATLVPKGAVLPACHMQEKNESGAQNDAGSKSQWVTRVGEQHDLVNRGSNSEKAERTREPYNTRSRTAAVMRSRGDDLTGTAGEALDIASKELGMSKGALLREQEELMKQFQKNKDKEDSIVYVNQNEQHLSDGMHAAGGNDNKERIPGVAYPRDRDYRNSVFYTDGDNAEDKGAKKTSNSQFYRNYPAPDYEHMAQQSPVYENVENTLSLRPTTTSQGQRRVTDRSDDSSSVSPQMLDLKTPEYFAMSPPKKPTQTQDSRPNPSRRFFPSETELDDTVESHARLTRTFSIGSMVEILGQPPKYGVIKWIGNLPRNNKDVVGVELEEDMERGTTDGTFQGKRYFSCPPSRGIFVYYEKCRPDSRFTSNDKVFHRTPSEAFGNYDSPMVATYTAPREELVPELCGTGRGIQGHHNSCYLDSTLFSMFAFSLAFDDLILRARSSRDLLEFTEVQTVLKEGIVNPLRKFGFVRADRVLKFRELLDKLGSVSGLTSEEKDPEEFLNTLFQQVFKTEPFLKMRDVHGEEHSSYFYQMFMDKDDSRPVPTVQQLFEQSFIVSDIKFVEVPKCLLVQMPRFGKSFKMYNRVIPSLELDITDVLEGIPRQCTICGSLAEYECKDCNTEKTFHHEQMTAYCQTCGDKTHSHPKRKNHKLIKLKIPDGFQNYFRENPHMIERKYMELFAVVCIETSHYVAFVKCGSGEDKQWCFFDSMADRIGEEDGHNIPAVTHLPEFVKWLENTDKIMKTDVKDMPEHQRRLVCDAYLLFYQSPEAIMYG
ncbi:ubiquitin carboxyl-terminal hydrolase CYLD-like isoform X2 [Glandiceps talaboti]